MKPGYKTTEFYLVALVLIVGIVVALGFVPADRIERGAGIAVSLLAALGWTTAASSQLGIDWVSPPIQSSHRTMVDPHCTKEMAPGVDARSNF